MFFVILFHLILRIIKVFKSIFEITFKIVVALLNILSLIWTIFNSWLYIVGITINFFVFTKFFQNLVKLGFEIINSSFGFTKCLIHAVSILGYFMHGIWDLFQTSLHLLCHGSDLSLKPLHLFLYQNELLFPFLNWLINLFYILLIVVVVFTWKLLKFQLNLFIKIFTIGLKISDRSSMIIHYSLLKLIQGAKLIIKILLTWIIIKLTFDIINLILLIHLDFY